MTIMKKAIADHEASRAVVLDLGDLKRAADQIITNAKSEADALLVEARTSAQKLIDRAHAVGTDEGYEAGERKGRREGQKAGAEEAREAHTAELAALTAQWTNVLESWEHDRERMLAAAREDVLRLALAIARKITVRIPRIDPSVVRDQLEASLELVTRGSVLAVQVHPDDRAIVEAALPQLIGQLTASAHCELVDAPEIARGGVRLLTAHGHVDATLDTQLDRIVAALLPDGDEVDDVVTDVSA